MQNIVLLAVGGAMGTLMRYGVVVLFASFQWKVLPYGTLAVNIIGSFIIGLFWGILGGNPTEATRHLLFLGILGGFTTFSSYALETLNLARNGQIGMALLYVALSNIIGLALVAMGFWAGNQLAR